MRVPEAAPRRSNPPPRIRIISSVTPPPSVPRVEPSGARPASLAVLIDADNVSSKIVEGLLDQIANYGVAVVRRIYGDFTKSALNGWKSCLLDHSITPIQQFAYTQGKNATDGALIIDAMDLLYTERFDGFCIVSSDSDFTRLAARIREQGKTVYGFGERKTPRPFVSACDTFIYVDTLVGSKAKPTEAEGGASKPASRAGKGGSRKVAPKPELDDAIRTAIRNAVEACAADDGWAPVSVVGSRIARVAPDFAPKNFGHSRLGDMLRALDFVEVKAGAEGRSAMVRLLQEEAPAEVRPAKSGRRRRRKD